MSAIDPSAARGPALAPSLFGTLLGLAAALGLEPWPGSTHAWSLSLPLVLVLCAGAAAAAWLETHASRHPLVRLSPSLVLAALVLLPAPGALAVAVTAAAAGWPVAAFGPATSKPWGLSGNLVAVALAERMMATLPAGGTLSLAGAAARLVTLWLALHLAAWLIHRPCARVWGNDVAPARASALALPAQAGAAWILTALTWAAGLPGAAVGAAAIGGVSGIMARLQEAKGLLERTLRRLEKREADLDALHELSRELLACVDTNAVLRAWSRSAEKLFPGSCWAVGLMHSETHEMTCTTGGFTTGASGAADPGALNRAARWVMGERHEVFVPDVGVLAPPAAAALRAAVDARSIMAAPLVAGGRTLGSLILGFRNAEAFDAAHRSAFGTAAQVLATGLYAAAQSEQSTLDPLTGMYLREPFFQRLREEYERAARYRGSFTLLMTDLDRFKAINDRHGHLAGDRYLRELGQALRSTLRRADLVCRYGGDEFCILLPETDYEGALVIARRVREAVAGLAVPHEDAVLRSTLSVGLAVFPDHHQGELRDLLRRADEALYHAKQAGRNRLATPEAAVEN